MRSVCVCVCLGTCVFGHVCACGRACLKGDVPITLRPRRVLLRHRFMTSVLAVKLNNWLIVFIGTGDGQLLKVRRP